MSMWTYINGVITVRPFGRTQAEKRYILDTVLEHLPMVTGSERDMNVYIIQKNGESSSCSCDEFGYTTNNLKDSYGRSSHSSGWLRVQDEYILVVNGSFRDRMFHHSLKEFEKWLCRLAKRVSVEDVLVEISGYEERILIRNSNDVYGKMFEQSTWSSGETSEPNWCEYLMWDRMRGCQYPLMLGYKYFNDEENDKEAKRRIEYRE